MFVIGTLEIYTYRWW